MAGADKRIDSLSLHDFCGVPRRADHPTLRRKTLPALFAGAVIAVVISGSLEAQTAPNDSTRADTTGADSIPTPGSAPDSAQKPGIFLSADEEEKPPPVEPFRFNMSAGSALLHSRKAQRAQINRAYYHDAGDFMRADRNFFTVDYQATPLRHTVSPFGLTGPRISPIFDGRTLLTLEHLPEQDGLLDFNDIPTASVNEVYALTGPLAAFLGSESGIAGVWLEKVRAAGPVAESRLEAQKGSFGYSYTKGILTEKTDNGFAYTAALGYRKADLFTLLNRDDSYHQFWELEAPLNRHWRLTNSLRLYRRNADYVYRPLTAVQDFGRRRRDRDIVSRLEHAPDERRRFAFEFRHQRTESTLEIPGAYKLSSDLIRNSLTLTRDQRFDKLMVSISAGATRSSLELEPAKNSRSEGYVSLKTLWPGQVDNDSESPRLFTEVGLMGVGGYFVLPRVNAGWSVQKQGWALELAAGVTPVFPRQYDLDLQPESPVSVGGVDDIDQRGTPGLQPERQYTAAAEITLGSPETYISFSAAGGSVVDGINWRGFSRGALGREFRPINENFTYTGLTVTTNIALADWLMWLGSGSSYNVAYDSAGTPPYAPDYNLFTGLTLDLYVRFLELYLTGYGELALSGPYVGFDGSALGEDPVVGARVSARVKSFKFHYVFENTFNRVYQAREQYFYPGRYSWYWITWDFLD